MRVTNPFAIVGCQFRKSTLLKQLVRTRLENLFGLYVSLGIENRHKLISL